ncbi:DUF3596 domain-containing protein [Klebsiella michiganensis]|nr:DUF3596 domain-containing protein [Klebsiella michiganensis]HBM2944925.1 DUF3596 domain-containing protein [Klebsiella michiganensis]HCI8835088.1 DUF3596 domain-containing protein [Klebsiella michiganensis]
MGNHPVVQSGTTTLRSISSCRRRSLLLPTGVEIHNGKIRIVFSYRGNRCRETLKGWVVNNANIKKAGHLRAKIHSEIQLGVFDYLTQFPDSRTAKKYYSTLRINTFQELCAAYHDAKELDITHASMRNLESTISTLTRLIGPSMLISEIQQMDILNYRKILLTGPVVNEKYPHLNKTGRAPATVNEQIRILCTMMKFAQNSNFINHSPFEKITMLKRPKKAPDPLTKNEYAELIKAVPKAMINLWVVAFYTGMRHGELCALSWGDVDLKKGTIHVHRNINNYDQFGPPKTDAGVRTITLLKPALDALQAQFAITGKDNKIEIVFHHREYASMEHQKVNFVFRPLRKSKEPNPYYSKNALRYSWKVGIEKSGIRNRVPYQSRHTYACWTLSAGANPSFIATQMGHENAKMVYEIYSKWMSEKDKDEIAMLNAKML